MEPNTITNEMLYELLKDFKKDVHKRFEQVDKRFERIENQQAEDHKILMELWENRSRQTLNFTSAYFLITLISSMLIALATSYTLVASLI